MDDGVTAYAEAQRRRAAVARAAAQSAIALGAARQRYAQGLVDFLNVNNAEAQFLQSQNENGSVVRRPAVDPGPCDTTSAAIAR